MNIVVSGYYGAINVGDEIVCKAVIEGIRSVLPNSDFTVVTANSARSRSFSGIDTKFLEGFYPSKDFWGNFVKYLSTLATTNLLVIGGGGLFQDVHSWKSACRHLVTASIAIFLGRPVVTVGLGVGPIRRWWLRHLIGHVASCFTKIQVRDVYSKEVLSACGVPSERISITADVVPLLQMKNYVKQRRASDWPERIGFALRPWPKLNERGVLELLDRVAQNNCEIWLLCYEPESDKQYYADLIAKSSQKCRSRMRVHVPENLEDSIRTLAAMDGVIGMRLHSCVLSAALGVPFLCISYDRKITMFAEQMGLADRTYHVEHIGSSCWDHLLSFINASNHNERVLNARFASLRQCSMNNFKILKPVANVRSNYWQRLKGFGFTAVLLSIGLTSIFRDIGHSFFHRIICIPNRAAYLPGGRKLHSNKRDNEVTS